MREEGFQPLEELDFGSSVRGLHAGQRLLDRYVLKRILGRGGMGVVWLSYDEALEREVAFKFLPEMVSHDRGALDDLKRETRRSLELTHPNIVRIYDFVHAEGCAGISMEFIDGDTLSNLRAERPNRIFDVADLKPWLKQLCTALEYAHVEAKLAHRDLKPANLMLSKRGVLKVADFGISRSVSDTMTRVNFHQGASGTLVYMSPQQALGERPSIADDIYSLGATIYELLTSKPPFYQGEIMLQVREKSAPTMAERRKELEVTGEPIPRSWEETIAACLNKDPALRPKSAQEVLERLEMATPKTEPNIEVVAPPNTTAPAPDAKPPEPRPRVELVLDDTGIHGTEKREAIPHTEIVRKGKALVAIVILLLLSLVAAWFVVSQASLTRKTDAAAAKARDDAARKEAADKETERLRLEKSAKEKTAEDARLAEQAAKAKAAQMAADAEALKRAAEARMAQEKEAQRIQNLRGSIKLETIPAGASVSIDDGPVQKSPVTLPDLKLGPHRITITRDGYVSTNLTSTIVEDKAAGTGSVNPLKIALVRSTGSAWLTSTPPGAEVTLKNSETNTRALTTPATFERLPTGTYQATLKYRGATREWETNTTVTVVSTDMARGSVSFPFGSLTIEGRPEGATVLRGNEEIGHTPLTLSELSPGKVEYTFKRKGYRPKTISTVVAAQLPNRLNYTLEAIKGPEKNDRWTNSLGMKFVPVGDGNVLVSIWETRVKDFSAFARNNPYNVGTGWENPGFPQDPSCPVVNVSWEAAGEFCKWLTQHERREGKLEKQRYRLPTDREWSQVAGLPQEPGALPVDRDSRLPGVYPWGSAWPPPAVPGNYDAVISYDSFDITAPVGSFRANRLGIFDLGGNVWEWCDDSYDSTRKFRVLRGGSWNSSSTEVLNSSYRRFQPQTERMPDGGFRIVLEVIPPS